MRVQLISRRAILESALATAAAATSGIPVAACGAATGGPSPEALPPAQTAERLLCWIRIGKKKDADVRIAAVLRNQTIVAQEQYLRIEALLEDGPSSAWGLAQSACRRAQGWAAAIAAQTWAVSPAECVVEKGRIFHPESGRAVGYAAWVDFG